VRPSPRGCLRKSAVAGLAASATAVHDDRGATLSLRWCFMVGRLYYAMRKLTPWIWLAAVLVAVEAGAVTPGGDYGKIAKRNVFGLRDTPATQPPTNAPQAAIPKLVLKGITTILGNKMAFLTVLPPGKAGTAPAKEETLMLAEGQREAGIEVLEIDTKAAQLKVNNSGTVMPLTFEKESEKTPAPASSSATPQPGQGAAPQAQGSPAPRQPRSSSYRDLRMQGATPTALTMPVLPTAVPAPAQTNTPSQLAAQPQTPAAAPLTQDEQALLQELEKATAPTQRQATVPAKLQRPPTMPQSPQ
jgi:hypothetical protein